MATSFSLLLIAAGAILAFAVDYQVQGVSIQAIGLILFVVGLVGLAFSLLFLASFAPFGTHDRYMDSPRGDHPRGGHTHDHV